ncbi:ubiquitin-2 like Rad60 SUMO-like-domain-containing protein [Phascolomyces articulosus]|uniref:Ubiquitin-2 like Rad60 SUMO-like-domain-containing protein n=1 Tax=Phascolomyces articulosus TaxID=60185 RepID=A0AAD5PHF4_9FUNG|nr:ubiquitin-2 like Rad60 SUMO-like-domain-containing protein [Phascolomyces articulosus]
MSLLHAENINTNNNSTFTQQQEQQHMTELQQQQPSSSSIAPLSMTSSNETTPPTTTDNGSAMAIRAPSSLSPTTTSDDQQQNNTNTLQQQQQHHEEEHEQDDDRDEQKLPLDRVHLTLLLVSGNRHTFEFNPLSTVSQVKKQVITEWPQEWESSRAAPQSVGFIELLYLGKFLDNDSTLESNRLRGGELFTVHLLVRDQQLKSADDTKTTEVPRCKCCIIL